ncbi:hypothetical protein B0O99DRAFT_690062 [Bisporella sp. PMI_857]|nr:hypothetical protein B0O99DRAFT_690062 [Bisporella sp. PMI_857]
MRSSDSGPRWKFVVDVYLPLWEGKYPVLCGRTIYGKRVVFGGSDFNNSDDIAAYDKTEDQWYSTTADVDTDIPNKGHWSRYWTAQRGFENIATLNTFTCVLHGYAIVKIDPRGVAKTPGIRGIPGQIDKDRFDAVEWAIELAWSEGSIALVGSSFGANVQRNTAQMKPQGLRCLSLCKNIIPF